ncbi:hypothetical protein GY45DRAFT_1341458 [Cubamyces sp. BRFM 1775]|nr:hypothetical protein GY45DRAFT_1341458 [Cubamyces sp. BRFM 1775]
MGNSQHMPSRNKGKQRASATDLASLTMPASGTTAALVDKPHTMALWPWEWRPEHSAVVHRQGCTICDAYLNHRNVKVRLGLNSIQHTMADMHQETRQAGYKDSYDHGYKDGHGDSVVVHTAKAELELNRLRTLVHHLQNRNGRLIKSVNLGRAAASIQEANSDESGWDSYVEVDNNNEADGPLKPLSEAEKQAHLKRWHDRERHCWVEQAMDVAHLQAVLAVSRSQLNPTLTAAKSQNKRLDPPHTIPSRGGPAPARARAPAAVLTPAL